MKRYSGVVQDAAGNAIQGATVSVTLTLDESAAELFADADGLSQLESNQVLTDAVGIYWFYVADGRYNLTGEKGGSIYVDEDVEIVDTAAYADRLAIVEGFAHYLSGTAEQVVVTPDENGDLVLSLPQSIAQTSDVTFKSVFAKRLRGSDEVPAVVYGNGAGGGGVPASQSLLGTGLFFRLTLTPGAAPTGTLAPIATFTFPTPFAEAPIVVMTPANRPTWALQGAQATAVTVQNLTQLGFSLNAGTTALTAGESYTWIFQVFNG